ncbi:hypothetical protein OROMI_010846 [Orobanche minor]
MVGEISTIGGGLMGKADQNPIAVAQAKFKEAETRFKGWAAKHAFPVEAAVVTGKGVAQGAAIGALFWTLFGDCASLVVTRIRFEGFFMYVKISSGSKGGGGVLRILGIS